MIFAALSKTYLPVGVCKQVSMYLRTQMQFFTTVQIYMHYLCIHMYIYSYELKHKPGVMNSP